MTRWLFTCRAGFEQDLAAELKHGEVLAPALAKGEPKRGFPTFGRPGFPLEIELAPTHDALAPWFTKVVGKAGSFALHVWVPDSDLGNPLSGRAESLRSALLSSLPDAAHRERRAHELVAPTDPLVQICVASPERAYAGASPASDVPSTWAGGRARMRLPEGAPSRASAKLLEAFTWIGVGPEAGELCVDLGAAPGGWTFVLLDRRARVIAVDRANMAPNVARAKKLVHARENAFSFLPDEPVDWLFCDMVHRPNEVARLVAKWGKQNLARMVVANFKLPMKQRLPVVLEIEKTVRGAGFKEVRTRQLYHDRDEVTLYARK